MNSSHGLKFTSSGQLMTADAAVSADDTLNNGLRFITDGSLLIDRGAGLIRKNLALNPAGRVNLANMGTFSTGGVGVLSRKLSTETPIPNTSSCFTIPSVGNTSRQYRIDHRNIPVQQGKTYTFSVYSRTSGSNNKSLALRWQDSDGVDILPQLSGGTIASTPNVWGRHKWTLTAPQGAVTCWIGVISSIAITPGYIDAVGFMVEESSTLGEYFDGDSPGATWDGIPNNSTSSIFRDDVVSSAGFVLSGDGKLYITQDEVSGVDVFSNGLRFSYDGALRVDAGDPHVNDVFSNGFRLSNDGAVRVIIVSE